MTCTCATKGCGEPIVWTVTLKGRRWVHLRDGIPQCWQYPRVGVAHPAGGTDTTPPEELEKKMTTMDDLKNEGKKPGDKDVFYRWDELRPLIEKMVEEARAEEREKHNECDAAFADEIVELREQLANALVPRFKVGERVMFKNTIRPIFEGPISVDGIEITYICNGVRYIEGSLSPLPEEVKCNHVNGFVGMRQFKFCPLCGEPLTRKGN